MDKIYISSIKEIENEFEYFISFLDEASKEYILNHKSHQARLQILLDRLLALKYLNTTIFKYNEYNKPYFKNCPIYFNISHCENMIALIISNKEVGIDIEKIREIKNKEIIAKKLNIKTNSSYKIIKRFSKMEAYFKKIGTASCRPNCVKFVTLCYILQCQPYKNRCLQHRCTRWRGSPLPRSDE